MAGYLRIRLALAVSIVLLQAAAVALLPLHNGAAQVEVGVAEAIPNRYIVRLRPTSGVSSTTAATTYDAQPGVQVDQVYSHVFNGFAGEFTNQAAARLARDPNVLDVFPDRLSYLAAQARAAWNSAYRRRSQPYQGGQWQRRGGCRYRGAGHRDLSVTRI